MRKIQKSLYELCHLCNKKENTREDAVNECREINEIREEQTTNLTQNFIFRDETRRWELIKKWYYGPEEGYLTQGKPSINYIKHFRIKLYN